MKNREPKMGSDRSFGIVFSVIFLIISFWPVISGEFIRLWSLLIAIVLFIISYAKPNLLHVPNKIWFKFGLFLGVVISPVVMGIIFFLVVTPTGLIMRMFGKDLLRNKFQVNNESYWIKKEKSKSSMKKQF